jgi:6-pyruvoyl-tetrahydropterin synthase
MLESHHHLNVVEQKDEMKFSTEEEMKEWFWQQHREEIMANCANGTASASSIDGTFAMNQKSPWVGQNKELDSARKSLRLLDFISRVQRQFMQQEDVCAHRTAEA